MNTKITLGGREWDLRYELPDRTTVEDMFPGPDGTPGRLQQLVQGHCLNDGGSIRVQATLLWVGMRHQKAGLSVAQVLTWIAEHLKKPGAMIWDLLNPMLFALGRDKTLGFQADAIEDAEGKAPDSNSSPA